MDLKWQQSEAALSGVFVIALSSLVALGILAVQAGVVGSILSGVFGLYGYYVRPRVKLRITGVKINGFEFGSLRIFQVRATVANKGKRLVLALDASPVVKKSGRVVGFLRLSMNHEGSVDTSDWQPKVKVDKVLLSTLPYSWERGRSSERVWPSLRGEEDTDLVFPTEHAASATEYTEGLRFEEGKFNIEIMVRGEDPLTHETPLTRKTVHKDLRVADWAKYRRGT